MLGDRAEERGGGGASSVWRYWGWCLAVCFEEGLLVEGERGFSGLERDRSRFGASVAHEGVEFHERVERGPGVEDLLEMEVVMASTDHLLAVLSILLEEEAFIFLESETDLLPL